MKLSCFSLSFMFTCFVFENFVGAIHELPLLLGGGPPLITDDTGTPGHNRWEINLAYTTRNTIHERATGFIVDANYGLGERTQLNLVIPHNSLDHDENGKDSGLGDIQFATKYRFIDETGLFPSVSATPAVFIPTSSEHTKPYYFLPLEFDIHIKSLYMGSQIGYLIHREKDENNELFYGFFGEYPVLKRLDAVGEIFGLIPEYTEVNPPLFNAGFRYRFSKLFSVMGSAGRSLGERSSGEPHLLGYIGIRLNF
ncbi:MAG TPA: transporter [Candidatus Brocadiia bacterium]|nr:transporter [Planctomycetota bacterium]MDO8092648.1 transporter [Candidatus Brocadiales bacterium]